MDTSHNNTAGSSAPKPRPKQQDSRRMIYILSAVAAVALLLAIVFFFMGHSDKAQLQAQLEQVELEKEQMALANEYAQLNSEFAQYENQSVLLQNDSIVEKYAAAKAKVEKLLQELDNEKKRNAARIRELEGEIASLKSILRTYVERIDELSRENEQLRNENTQVRSQNQQLNQTLTQAQQENEQLSERMTLAEKLNVTSVTFKGLKSNGKVEKNITKAKQLALTFTIPQNNSTPVGNKAIYMRIINPEGDLLPGNGVTFTFEGAQLQCSASKVVEYTGDEIQGITMYWDVNTTLNAGEYLVELFADNFRIYSHRFTMTR